MLKVDLALFLCPSATLTAWLPAFDLGATNDLMKLPVASVVAPSAGISLSS
jgi:hypothetical protein